MVQKNNIGDVTSWKDKTIELGEINDAQGKNKTYGSEVFERNLKSYFIKLVPNTFLHTRWRFKILL